MKDASGRLVKPEESGAISRRLRETLQGRKGHRDAANVGVWATRANGYAGILRAPPHASQLTFEAKTKLKNNVRRERKPLPERPSPKGKPRPAVSAGPTAPSATPRARRPWAWARRRPCAQQRARGQAWADGSPAPRAARTTRRDSGGGSGILSPPAALTSQHGCAPRSPESEAQRPGASRSQSRGEPQGHPPEPATATPLLTGDRLRPHLCGGQTQPADVGRSPQARPQTGMGDLHTGGAQEQAEQGELPLRGREGGAAHGTRPGSVCPSGGTMRGRARGPEFQQRQLPPWRAVGLRLWGLSPQGLEVVPASDLLFHDLAAPSQRGHCRAPQQPQPTFPHCPTATAL